MTLSIPKCQSMILGKEILGARSFSLNGNQLQEDSKLKLLRIYIDSYLTFDFHISHMLGQGTTVLQQIHRMAGQFWGLRGEAIGRLVWSILWPTIYYANGVWATQLTQAHLRKLDGPMQKTQLMTTGCLSTISHTALGSQTEELPGQLRLI